MDFLKHWRDIRYNNLKLLFDKQTNQLYKAINDRDDWEHTALDYLRAYQRTVNQLHEALKEQNMQEPK